MRSTRASLQRAGIGAICLLSEKLENKVLLVQHGALEPLLQLCTCEDPVFQRLTISTLSNLADIEENCSLVFQCSTGVSAIARLMQHVCVETRCLAVHTLASLLAPQAILDETVVVEQIEAHQIVDALVNSLKPTSSGETEFHAAQVFNAFPVGHGCFPLHLHTKCSIPLTVLT